MLKSIGKKQSFSYSKKHIFRLNILTVFNAGGVILGKNQKIEILDEKIDIKKKI